MKPEDQLRSETIQPVASATETVREQDKIMLILAYIGILSLIPLLTVKDSEFVKWHAKQGLVLTIAAVVAGIALAIITSILGWIPFIGAFIGFIGGCGLFIGFVAMMFLGIKNALAGQRWRIPVVADLADKL